MIKFQDSAECTIFKNSAIEGLTFHPDCGRLIVRTSGEPYFIYCWSEDNVPGLEIILTGNGKEEVIKYETCPRKKEFKTEKEWEVASEVWADERFDFWTEACDRVMSFLEENG